MVTSFIQGGFGNQLFQYAAAYALSKDTNRNLVLNCGFYNHKFNKITPREYNLDKLNIKKDATILNKLGFTLASNIEHFVRRIPFLSSIVYPTLLVEDVINCRNYQKKLWEKAHLRKCSLYGFWQNTNYFSQYKDDLKQMFTPAYQLDQTVIALKKDIINTNSVGIHIRRGDFVQLGWNKDDEYYNKGLQLMRKLHPDCVFYIFTDDPVWARNNYANIANIIDVKTTTKDIDEFFLLSQCKHLLISESTYGWWAAYLNNHPAATIIVPRDAKGELFERDWIRL